MLLICFVVQKKYLPCQRRPSLMEPEELLLTTMPIIWAGRQIISHTSYRTVYFCILRLLLWTGEVVGTGMPITRMRRTTLLGPCLYPARQRGGSLNNDFPSSKRPATTAVVLRWFVGELTSPERVAYLLANKPIAHSAVIIRRFSIRPTLPTFSISFSSTHTNATPDRGKTQPSKPISIEGVGTDSGLYVTRGC